MTTRSPTLPAASPQPASERYGAPENRVVFIAYDAEGHVGSHLIEAAAKVRIPYRVMSPALAFDAPWLISKINWHVRGHRPTRLAQFGQRALELSTAFHATHVIATGIAPLPADIVRAMRRAGMRVVNWLTDDPWNPVHKAPWFMSAIPEYDVVFTPRSALLDDLRQAQARRVELLPFAYCGACHYAARKYHQRPVVSFVGGADKDRVPYIQALIAAGIPVELYGGYWNEQRATQEFAAGFVDAAGYRAVVTATAVSLCLVRAANRDGHVMRSYELPAMRGCILAQDTLDHRELYGPDGETVRFFKGIEDIGQAARALLRDPAERERLALAVHTRVVRPENAYDSRLDQLLG
ncbi:MAG TPA: glycosyltransferase [Longimicrobiales bacterium]|nr:glycosyltransferase [Longimicrobiales bacterium]